MIPMASRIRIATSKTHAIECWSVLCLLLAVLALVVPSASASADMHHSAVELVGVPMDDHPDCDHGLAGMASHCHTTSSCFAQAVAATISLDLRTSNHPNLVSQDDITSWWPQPSLRPPKRSIQA